MGRNAQAAERLDNRLFLLRRNLCGDEDLGL
jgi:hypothetical protein